jgi:alpha-galactosidase
MNAPLKIAVVGAGSAQFLVELADLCALDGLGPYEVALVDTHPTRLAVVEQMGRRVADQLGVPATITAPADRAAALDGATAVLTSIGVGMQDSIRPDFEIPARYGLRQTVADTVGIGAIVRILRTAPVLTEIARDMAARCPEALLLNVTNPMAMCMMALRRTVPEIASYGLCHSTWMTAATVAELLEIPIAELSFAGAGVNHQVFLTRLEHEGNDVYPRLRALARSDHPFAATVRADLLRRFGYFVTESSKHNAEYVPWYLPWDELVERHHLPVNPYWKRRADNAEWFSFASDVAAGHRAFPEGLLPSGEYAPQIIRSLVDGERRDVYVNVPNDDGAGGRWVAELPDWAMVEVPGHSDAGGVHPHRAEPLPPQCAAVNRRYLDVCDLAVRAVVEGRRDHVHHAALLDANASSVMPPDRIAEMIDELLDVHQEAGRLPEALWRRVHM